MAEPESNADDPSEDTLEVLFDAFMERALGRGSEAGDADELDPERFLADHPDVSGQLRQELLLRLEAISRLAAPVVRQEANFPDDLTEEELGRRVGEYRLIRSLGGGAMGEVFLAEQSSLGRMVALKTQRAHLSASPTAAARFEREARALGAIQHPSVVGIHGFGRDAEVSYLAMELVPGRSLKELLETPRPGESQPTAVEVARWGAGLARGLEAVHAAGLVHRDVKPANIRICDDDAGGRERAVLVDFGLARTGETSELSRTGEFVGSPAYASPEQVRGDDRLDGRSDVYSLGATLYHALAGRAPFRGDNLEAVLHRVLSREPAPLASLAPGVPRDLALVVHKALEKEPERRYASAAELAADLEAVLELRPVSAKPPGPIGRALRWARRNKAASFGLGAATFSLVAAAAWVSWNQHTDQVARRREAATSFQQAGLELETFRASRLALAQDEAEFDRIWLLQEYEHLGDDRLERLGALEAGVRAARESRDTAFARANNALDACVRLDPTLDDAARSLRAELVLERLREAQDKMDQDAIGFLHLELSRLDAKGELTDRAFPFGRLVVAGTLPDTRAWLFRFAPLDTDEAVLSRAHIEPTERRLVPVPELPGAPDWSPASWSDGQPPVPFGTEVLRLGETLAEFDLWEGDLLLSLDGASIAGGPFVRSVDPEPQLGEPTVLAGDRLIELDGVRLTDPLDLEVQLTAERDEPARGEIELTFEAHHDGHRVTMTWSEAQAMGLTFESIVERAQAGSLPAEVHGLTGTRRVVLPPDLTLARTTAAVFLEPDGAFELPTEGTELKLLPGEYLLVHQSPDRRPTRAFLRVLPGAEGAFQLTPLPAFDADDGPPFGFARVEAALSQVPAFFIAEHEVTAAEYLEFLNEPAQLARVDAALLEGRATLFPRAGNRVDATMWPRNADGTFALPATWPRDWPVLGVSFDDARAYCTWRTAREGHGVYRLPAAVEMVYAGTGDGQRSFSWGARFDQRFANTCFSRAIARPERIASHPRDESPYGIYDTCGNALEWVSDWYDESRNLRHACGGAWGQARIDTLAAGGGIGMTDGTSSGETGFRMVWEERVDGDL